MTVVGDEPLVVELDPGTEDVDAGSTEPRVTVMAPGVVVAASKRSPSSGVTTYEVVVDGWRFEVEVEPAARAVLRDRARRGAARDHARDARQIRAQIPGRVLRVVAIEGEAVEVGQVLLVVEAMKMENAVVAPWAGTIARVGVVAGQTVELGDELVVIG